MEEEANKLWFRRQLAQLYAESEGRPLSHAPEASWMTNPGGFCLECLATMLLDVHHGMPSCVVAQERERSVDRF